MTLSASPARLDLSSPLEPAPPPARAVAGVVLEHRAARWWYDGADCPAVEAVLHGLVPVDDADGEPLPDLRIDARLILDDGPLRAIAIVTPCDAGHDGPRVDRARRALVSWVRRHPHLLLDPERLRLGLTGGVDASPDLPAWLQAIVDVCDVPPDCRVRAAVRPLAAALGPCALSVPEPLTVDAVELVGPALVRLAGTRVRLCLDAVEVHYHLQRRPGSRHLEVFRAVHAEVDAGTGPRRDRRVRVTNLAPTCDPVRAALAARVRTALVRALSDRADFFDGADEAQLRLALGLTAPEPQLVLA